jgi:hypothetical protein
MARRLFLEKKGIRQWREGYFWKKTVFTNGEKAVFEKKWYSPMARRLFSKKKGIRQ